MHRLNRVLSGVLVAVALGACSDALTVKNTNNPDRVRVFARATDIEALISGAYNTLFNGTFGTDGLAPSARTMSWENASNLANWGLGPRSAIPRSMIDNTRGNPYQGENQADFNATSRAARAAADGLLNWMIIDAGSPGSRAQDARARAFGWYVIGLGMGYLAMNYDSGTVISPYDEVGAIPPLVGYADVNAAALAALDSAFTWTTTASTATGLNGFPLPNTWINGYAPTAADFIRLIRSYRAYFRANVARTPTERAAVTWATVAADAAAGITTNIMVTTGPGWTMTGNQWWLWAQWHQLHQLIGGMADSTGAYPTWLASANKTQFLIVTADRRFPQGTTRADQILAMNSPAVPVGTIPAVYPYFRNRASADPDAAPWSSYYDWYRMIAWANATRVGPYPVFVKAQNDLLWAEALIRTNQVPAAAALIDISRVAAGLPALAGVITDSTQAVPGGAGCVPHVPQRPSYTTTACGHIMEAMKWEYRMETMFVSYVSQWYSGRGWGDLPNGTAVHWPVPYNEMDTRLHPFYNLGGVGATGGSVGVGNYGY